MASSASFWQMDELFSTAAQTLPNLMSMIGMFISEHRHQKGLRHQEFMEWLETHRFEELKRIIETTHGLEREIDVLLKAQQSEILSELGIISETVTKIASKMEIFGGVTKAVTPSVHLSGQALEILKLLDEAHPSNPTMNLVRSSRGDVLFVGLMKYGFSEARHITEDFNDLLNAGFIMLHHYTSDKGEPAYCITRLGAEYAKKLPAVNL